MLKEQRRGKNVRNVSVIKGLLLVILIGVVHNSWAADAGFVDDAKGIVNQLTKKSKKNYGTTRSFFLPEQKTRAIVVRVKQTTQEGVQDKKVFVKEDSPEGVARLKVEFDVNSSRLRKESYDILDQLGLALGDVRLSNQQVCIKGHTDSDGTDQYNLGLSYDRAEAVKEYVLSKNDLKVKNLFVVGYGEQMPIAANDSYAHKQMNRRVEVSLGCSEVQ